MNPQAIRGLLATLTVVLAAAGALASFEWPIDTGPLLFAAACAPAFLLLADRMLGGWLERHRGDAVTPADFLREQWHGLALRIGALMALAGVAGLLKTHVLMEDRAWPGALALAGALLASLASLAKLATRKTRRADPIRDLYELTRKRTLDDGIADAAAFNRAVAPRLLPDFAMLAAFGVAMGALSVAIGMGVFRIGTILEGTQGVSWGTRLNLVSQLGVVVGCVGVGVSYAAVSLTLFRLVGIARRTGRRPGTGTHRQLGHALETVGILSTAPWSLVVVAILALLAFSAWVVASLCFPPGHVGIAVSVFAGTAVLAWGLLALPQMYVFALFCHRDCGWMNAVEASTVLVGLEGPAAIRRALVVTLWTLSIVRIPGAIHLILGTFDGRGELLAAVLREKRVGDAVGQVLDAMSNQPEALRRPYEALEAGRYLEALNAFQIYLRKNRGDVSATRGECLALLRLGNFRAAREKLEYWKNIDPAASEPDERLAEIRANRWEDAGDLLIEARKRSTEAALKPPPSMKDFAPP